LPAAGTRRRDGSARHGVVDPPTGELKVSITWQNQM